MYAYAVENQRKNWFTGVRHTRNQQKQLILSIGDRTDLQRKMSFCDSNLAGKTQRRFSVKIKVQEGAYEDRVTGKSKNRHW